MTKRPWLPKVILVAGTIVLAACPGTSAFGPCEVNEETGETFCNQRITDPSATLDAAVTPPADTDH